ncbi:hypothetical protein PHLGIDRAFT_108161 [Phlebiopsis gigantea 11061_1 CR5-6]|uniref:Zn(2)-C6 fungal-type domain-containing protein n=1 Tax=Phlebiopsis gigantea (strain 11061_1 CR5-6) TaxID=745531 RepID=A0A0C3NKG0_PHLG1|nr:hypothetical protein PHLGIDRAFT_108161 [Phlebiopsis gigantea 11061_1 CR5-6]
MASTGPSMSSDKGKRRGAPLSCAECRRLKLRCSRVFPCASCVKKGCAAICPDGSLTTGKGNRFVLANTEALHEKIQTLANRVRELEDALEVAHGHINSDTHPLLSHELRQIKRPLEREAPESPKDVEVDTAEAIDQVGSLSISDSGRTKFYGGMANAWYLLQNEEGGDDETENAEIALPTDLPWLGYTFPFATVTDTKLEVRRSLFNALPNSEKASHLAAIYYRHCAWMYTPIPENEFYSTVFARIYDQNIALDQDPIDSHRLAVLYMVFALGTLFDLEKQSLSLEATQYYQLARAALSMDPVLEHQTIPAIQALVLMCHFMFMSFRDGPRWGLMGLVVKLAQGLGLHRDGGKWNLDPEEAFRRRSLFWEVYTYDSWQSLTFGRPPSFSNAFVDCHMPEPEPQSAPDKGDEVEMTYTAWKHRFVSRCLNHVHEQAFGARIPSYKTIQELDKKVRNFHVPPSLRVPGFGGAKMMEVVQPSIQLTMQRHIVFAIKEISIFYLHRGFFARAIEDNPEDPLSSKFAQSVLAAYTSACTFVGLVKSLHSQHPQLTERHWFLFTHVFSCAIVLGSIAAKCPGMPFARSALMNLDSAYNLFEMVKETNRAGRVLPVLQKLKLRAVTAMSAHPQNNSAHPQSRQSSGDSIVKEEDDELAALGGKTRLVPSQRKSPSLPSPSSPQDSVQLHQTPSPQHSPMQPYSIEAHASHDHNGSHAMGQWSGGYQSPADGVNGYAGYYSTPAQGSGHWPHDNYGSQSMTSPIQYPPYSDIMSPVGTAYPLPHPTHSPIEMQIHGDPQASWHSFYAQYQQGMN